MLTNALPLASFAAETVLMPVFGAALATALLIVVVLLIRPSTGAGST